jgi:hypothetical protein
VTTVTYDLGELVAERLTSQPGYELFRGNPINTPGGAYAVLYLGAGGPLSTRQDGQQRRLQWSFRVVCAGRSDVQVLNTVDRVRTRLLGWRPLSERWCGRLTELFTDPPLTRDDTAPNDVRYSLTLTFQLATY